MGKDRNILRCLAPLALALGLGLSMGLPSTHTFAAQHDAQASQKQHNAQVAWKHKPCHTDDRACKCDKDDLACRSKQSAPEAPLAVGLPLSALAVFGVYVLRQRQRGEDPEGLDGLAV